MASFHHEVKSGKKGTAAKQAMYITRRGQYATRADLLFTGHGNMPSWTNDDPMAFWGTGDKHERANAAVYREHVIALPAELTREQLPDLVDTLVKELVGVKPYQFAVHAPTSALEGVENTHVHLMFSDRLEDGIERSPELTFKRYNAKVPELGGRKKDSGNMNKMELRDNLIAARRRCAEVQNAALAKYGHSARVDHRTLKQQGVKRIPERHLGPEQIRSMDCEAKERFVANRQQFYSPAEAGDNHRA
jgi:hypothetical protein